ncbi:MAG TPA: HAD-IIIA family hydrolase [Acidimicrobiales bacterium]|nr:HAD-IIIA family hydrolase [Acidimicrobiales bacterium]
MSVRYSVVVPTVGRPSLAVTLAALLAGRGPAPEQVIVVDDRRSARSPLEVADMPGVQVVAGRGAGPAAARNCGWARATGEWVAFLDDDVVPDPDWPMMLGADLEGLDPSVAGSQGRITVPLPAGRRPTDWERNVAGLERARWATADLAYRRDVLDEVGGFDERFPRAFREDADLGVRITAAGYLIVRGERCTAHPVRPAGWWTSVRLQAGNADDALMRALHGPDWRRRSGAGPGRNARHVATVASLALAAAGAAARRPALASVGMAGWTAGTAELTFARLRTGPLTPSETVKMVSTSAVLPAAAVWHRLKGAAKAPGLVHGGGLPHYRRPSATFGRDALPRWFTGHQGPPAAVLFDRDGTLVDDVAYNGDPERVRLVPGARQAVRRLRRAGVAVGVVTNQSGVGRGLLASDQVAAVNGRVDRLLGGLDVWRVCPHGPDDGCACRKPAPGLIKMAAADLGVDPSECAVIGDIGADVEAAAAAGARAVLVPTPATRPEEVRSAPQLATDLLTAVDLVLGGRC